MILSDKKTEQILHFFNSVAAKYDFMNTLLSFGLHHFWKRSAVRILGLKSSDYILDVCGGTGDLSVLASITTGSSGHVILYDINREMIAAGKTKLAGSLFKNNIFYVQGNAEQLSFSDQCFDAVMVGFGIRNLTNLEKGIKEMYRVLKPGGKMICLEFSKPNAPVFRWLYDFYSFHILIFLGELIADAKHAYTHLIDSIRSFPLPDELSTIFKKAGFPHVTYYRLTNGIVVIHLAEKTDYEKKRKKSPQRK